MVDKFQTVLNQITSKYGNVSLFVVMKMDELIDKWTVIISADWITDQNRAEIFNSVASVLTSIFTSEEMSTIARLGILVKSHYIAQEFLKKYQGTATIKEEQVNGFKVHEGYVLAAISTPQTSEPENNSTS